MNKKKILKLKLGRHRIDRTLLNQARKEGNIVFGGKSIKRSLGFHGRPSKDWDFFSKTPKKSAIRADNNLDKTFGENVFFKKMGANPGTWKIKHVGLDGKPRTKDDVGIADFQRIPKPKPKTFESLGINFRNLNDEKKAKKRLVEGKEFDFRRQKDLEDLKRIKKYGRLK